MTDSATMTSLQRIRDYGSITELDTSDTSDSDDAPEHDLDSPATGMNLGAETPASLSEHQLRLALSGLDGMGERKKAAPDAWATAGFASTDVPTRSRRWRSNSFNEKKKLQRAAFKELVDRDCGICFEPAVKACRTRCCQQLFCLEHLCDWLDGQSSDGKCPSCKVSLVGETEATGNRRRFSQQDLSSEEREALSSNGGLATAPLNSGEKHTSDRVIVLPYFSPLGGAGVLSGEIGRVFSLFGLGLIMLVLFWR